ncbi:hypothetical protein C0991_005031 [Blastosporella zonata]|nr:hypothetical protein C0991_005031 [Blastosporella zonata]
MASSKIKIAARLRPRLDGEIVDDSVKIMHDTGASGSVISVVNPRDPSQVFKFPFTSCYDQNSNQEEIFLNDVQPMIDVVFSGVTVTIFAYGVTSSGKTHTMQGSRSEPGVIPRTIRAMFDRQKTITGYDVSLFVSYMEIYKDEVYDLLVTRENAPKLPVRENDAGMVFVANLTSERISTVDEFDAIYNQATKHRSVGATNLNRASSRSHAVLTIEARMYDPVENPSRRTRRHIRWTHSTRSIRTKNVENKPVINERDNRPVPKPHFAAVAIQPPAGRPAPAIIQAISTAGSSSGPAPGRSRQSLVPVSRVPRASISGGYQSFTMHGARRGFVEKIREEDESDRSGSMGMGLTEKEIDERISRAVEAEVTRRLAERERQREKEEEDRRERERERQQEQELEFQFRMTQPKLRSPKKEQTVPSGVLTPLLKRHRDLDDELKLRLQELERKLQAPLARAHSEKFVETITYAGGDLQVALDLYRKAESYVPDNTKLKERIIEIEWAVKNDREFVPSPKPARRSKKQKKAKAFPIEDTEMDVDEYGRISGKAEFGQELTNSPGKPKRQLDVHEGDDEAGTPPKKQRTNNGKAKAMVAEDGDDEDWVSLAPSNTVVS